MAQQRKGALYVGEDRLMQREMVRKTTRRLKKRQMGWEVAEYACQFGAVWFMLAAVLMLADAGRQASVGAVLLYMGWAVGMSLAGLVMLAFAMEFGRKAVNTSLVAMLVVCCYDAKRMKPGSVCTYSMALNQKVTRYAGR